jgi:hypothetical protein
MGSRRIIALDLGKFKTVACVMDALDRSHVFETIEMSPASVHALLTKHATPDPAETQVVFETCDCCGWVYDLCAALTLPARVVAANTEAWHWRRVKRKTDRDDALKLARLALLDQLTIVHMPSPQQRQRRRLILHRRSIVARGGRSRATRSARSSASRASRWPAATSSGRRPASRSCASTRGRCPRARTCSSCGAAGCTPSCS